MAKFHSRNWSSQVRKTSGAFWDIHNVWSATAAELAVLPFLNRKDILNLTNVKFKQDVERHLENIHKNDIKVITLEDELYPAYLKNIYDPPLVLYMKEPFKRRKNIWLWLVQEERRPMDWIWRRKYPESLLNAVLPL